MNGDVAIWAGGADCSRCGQRADHYVAPYWRDGAICPTCCTELNALYDRYGWPQPQEEK